jgi:hypothetical protein
MANANTVRVFVGTRKGGYVVESDAKRRNWKVKGPFQPGREVFHIVADPRHPGDVYAAVNSAWFGPIMQRSSNWGKTWTEIGTPMMVKQPERPNPMDAGGMPTYPIANLWHIEPGPANEPSTVFLGVDPAALYRSDDKGESWESLKGLNEHETRPKWNPGAGGMCLHTILIDPTNPKRMYVGISAAGTFRSDNGGETWRPVNKGVEVSFQPEKLPEVGQCVHDCALDTGNPSTIYRQDHDGIYISHDGMDSWTRVGKPLAYDFGFVSVTAKSLPGTAFFVPLQPQSRLSDPKGLQVYRWEEKTKKFTPTIKGRPFEGDYGVHREGMAADSLDPAGLYLGTTTGQLFFSPDAAKTWQMVPYNFPGIHSVSAA